MTQHTTKLGNQQYLLAMEQLEWRMYCAPRFSIGSQAEMDARRQFQDGVTAAWDAMYSHAHRNNARLDFTAIGLRLLALRALDAGCTYCTQLLSLDRIGYTWDTPSQRSPVSCWREANLVICCAACAQAKGSLSGSEWRDVMAALRAAEPTAAELARQALAIGRAGMDGRTAGKRYSPTPRARR